MNHIKIIRTHQEHEQALARLMSLMDIEPAPDTSEADELDVLALLIERYEQEHFPIDEPDPIEAIKFRMDQQGLIQKDLVPYIGSASKVSEVLSRSRPLSLNMIRKISEGLDISADVLIRELSQQVAKDSDTDWLAFPLAEMRKRNYFDGFSGSLRELKEYAAEHLNSFLSSVSGGLALQPTMLRSSAHLRSNDKETEPYALWAWQVKVLRQAQEETLHVRYKQGSVDLDFMRKLAELSWSEQGPLLAREYLNRSGIHLVIEPHMPKTYLDGALCLHANGSPVIAITLRHDRLDNFWFTLMHELAHIALHVESGETWFIDDLDVASADQMEQEADILAQDALIPKDIWIKETPSGPAEIKALAQKLNISSSIVAGRIRHEAGDHLMFGKQFRARIRPIFSNN